MNNQIKDIITPTKNNLFEVDHLISAKDRELRNGHKGSIFWFTGLSGSGKSTIAMGVERFLFNRNLQVYVLDGDNVRRGLNRDLGFSEEDRKENIRRISEVASLLSDAGIVVITAFISPFKDDREVAKSIGGSNFHEIFINSDLDTCERRDVKGLYKLAREGKIKDFTGISSAFDKPENPDLILDTMKHDVEDTINQMAKYIWKNVRIG